MPNGPLADPKTLRAVNSYDFESAKLEGNVKGGGVKVRII